MSYLKDVPSGKTGNMRLLKEYGGHGTTRQSYATGGKVGANPSLNEGLAAASTGGPKSGGLSKAKPTAKGKSKGAKTNINVVVAPAPAAEKAPPMPPGPPMAGPPPGLPPGPPPGPPMPPPGGPPMMRAKGGRVGKSVGGPAEPPKGLATKGSKMAGAGGAAGRLWKQKHLRVK